MEIKKEDLVFSHYTWYENSARVRQDIIPTRRSFDKNNGFHILWITNWYIAEHPEFRKSDIAKLEILLSEKLPPGLLSEISVYNWLANT